MSMGVSIDLYRHGVSSFLYLTYTNSTTPQQGQGGERNTRKCEQFHSRNIYMLQSHHEISDLNKLISLVLKVLKYDSNIKYLFYNLASK